LALRLTSFAADNSESTSDVTGVDGVDGVDTADSARGVVASLCTEEPDVVADASDESGFFAAVEGARELDPWVRATTP
jgi:hypothetical protein